ncbi:hypothetical protein GSI_02802 [Ganoderma sinense ZZ0214-1]|uniref:DUF6534 domain-containing protein n=1 Tax=Ganoderma sinense ZZ0214-1 TaxID=1077348 RepID=A0A2G8SMM1_9APHY|nr:hypothetical protein GSI_02802 [Ganoderma sinense ZZ0214-1]
MAMAPGDVAFSLVLASNATVTPFELPKLDNTYGALLLGASFGFMLYGLTVHQTYRYFRLYPTDIPVLRWLVLVILVLETAHTAMALAGCYYHLITKYFDPLALLAGHWSTRWVLAYPFVYSVDLQYALHVQGTTILVCQCFYARRIWHVGPNYRYIVGVTAIPMIALLGDFKLSLNDFRHVSWMASAVFGFAVLADILLSGALILILWQSRTGFKRTDSTIEVLIIYTINTGLLTTIVGLLGFVFAIILPGNFIYIGISIVGTKLYANSVLAVLNSRRALANQMLVGFEMGSFEPRNVGMRPHTIVETWDMPQLPLDLPMAESHMSFARPANIPSSFDSDTVGTGSSSHMKTAPSGVTFDGKFGH